MKSVVCLKYLVCVESVSGKLDFNRINRYQASWDRAVSGLQAHNISFPTYFYSVLRCPRDGMPPNKALPSPPHLVTDVLLHNWFFMPAQSSWMKSCLEIGFLDMSLPSLPTSISTLSESSKPVAFRR